MRKFLSAILLSLLLTLTYASPPAVEAAIAPLHPTLTPHETAERTEGGILKTFGRYWEISLPAAEAARWPNLAAAIASYNEGNRTTVDAYYGSLCEQLREMTASGQKNIVLPYQYDISTTIARADEAVFSVTHDVFSNNSGGFYAVRGGVNYAPATGEVMRLTDVVPDIRPLCALLSARLHGKHPALTAEKIRELLEQWETENLKYWLLTDSSLFIFLFSGDVEQQELEVVTFAERPDIFARQYIK